MALHSRRPALQIEKVGEVTVARLIRPDFVDEETINGTGSELFHMVEEQGCRQMVLSWAKVKRAGSAMLGKVIWLHKRIQAVGGRLVLCDVDPILHEAFASLQLTRLFKIFPTEQEAVQSFA
jgi:anti-sigma B factor antagonist